MTINFVIRDDDTSYLTSPGELEELYRPIWEHGAPVCLSVIPAHFTDVKVEYYGQSLDYDPNIPISYRGIRKHHLLIDNETLCGYLQALVKSKSVEIELHGFSHKHIEFGTEDISVLRKQLDAGASILNLVFPAPSTFVAPYDFLSSKAIRIVMESGYNLCTSLGTLKEIGILNLGDSNDHVKLIENTPPFGLLKYSDQLIFTSDQYFFNDLDDPDECLRNASETLNSALKANTHIFICTNHYWQFFRHGKGNGYRLLDKWFQFMETIFATPEIEISSFSNLPTKLRVAHLI